MRSLILILVCSAGCKLCNSTTDCTDAACPSPQRAAALPCPETAGPPQAPIAETPKPALKAGPSPVATVQPVPASSTVPAPVAQPMQQLMQVPQQLVQTQQQLTQVPMMATAPQTGFVATTTPARTRIGLGLKPFTFRLPWLVPYTEAGETTIQQVQQTTYVQPQMQPVGMMQPQIQFAMQPQTTMGLTQALTPQAQQMQMAYQPAIAACPPCPPCPAVPSTSASDARLAEAMKALAETKQEVDQLRAVIKAAPKKESGGGIRPSEVAPPVERFKPE